ncbi:hypothetical protein EVAR_11871_1 [Eumeta japonica]|uniref:Uncharacterized protein n=1 Tax=Eumeta variegata TaxID=151549 RepID=A0A4C1U7K3_EUMVA|nr:hypothetical protein EVAR_11871_1 [Eumeta japonica]
MRGLHADSLKLALSNFERAGGHRHPWTIAGVAGPLVDPPILKIQTRNGCGFYSQRSGALVRNTVDRGDEVGGDWRSIRGGGEGKGSTLGTHVIAEVCFAKVEDREIAPQRHSRDCPHIQIDNDEFFASAFIRLPIDSSLFNPNFENFISDEERIDSNENQNKGLAARRPAPARLYKRGAPARPAHAAPAALRALLAHSEYDIYVAALRTCFRRLHHLQLRIPPPACGTTASRTETGRRPSHYRPSAATPPARGPRRRSGSGCDKPSLSVLSRHASDEAIVVHVQACALYASKELTALQCNAPSIDALRAESPRAPSIGQSARNHDLSLARESNKGLLTCKVKSTLLFKPWSR